jgi:predicted RND superfamily exporter protein
MLSVHRCKLWRRSHGHGHAWSQWQRERAAAIRIAAGDRARGGAQEEKYKGLVVSSSDWVTAVTYVKIAGSVHGTVLLSIVLSGVVVFTFTGRPVLSLIATGTVVLTNVSVAGLLYVWGWHLGAIEGMSITSLVGLSVDFCIHLCEGHMHAKAKDRFGKSRCAAVHSCQRSSRTCKLLTCVRCPGRP